MAGSAQRPKKTTPTRKLDSLVGRAKKRTRRFVVFERTPRRMSVCDVTMKPSTMPTAAPEKMPHSATRCVEEMLMTPNVEVRVCRVCAQHGRDVVGWKTTVGATGLIRHMGSMITTSRRQGQAREGLSEGGEGGVGKSRRRCSCQPRLNGTSSARLRFKHYGVHTNRPTSTRQPIRHFDKRNPREMGAKKILAFLSHLAVAGNGTIRDKDQSRTSRFDQSRQRSLAMTSSL
jgi:hypothetical protein